MTPKMSFQCITVSFVKDFVKIFSYYSWDLQCSYIISPSSINSLTKWYLVSIFLLFLWNTMLLDKEIAILLSQYIFIISSFWCLNSFRILLIQHSWQPTLFLQSIYLQVWKEKQLVLSWNPMKWLLKTNEKHNVLWYLYHIPFHSLPIYAALLNSFIVVYKIPFLLVLLTYHIIILVANQCFSFGVSMNLETKINAYIRQLVIVVKFIKIPTMFYLLLDLHYCYIIPYLIENQLLFALEKACCLSF